MVKPVPADDQLWNRVRVGDYEGAERLWEVLRQRVFTLAKLRLGGFEPGGSTPDDIADEVLAKFYCAVMHGSVHTERIRGVMRWLRQATAHQIDEQLRKDGRNRHTSVVDFTDTDCVEAIAITTRSDQDKFPVETLLRLHEEVERLRPRYRSVIRSIDLLGFSAAIFAHQKQMTPDGVRMLHQRALVCLQKRMRGASAGPS